MNQKPIFSDFGDNVSEMWEYFWTWGNTCSFLAAEKETWTVHTLVYDEKVRRDNLPFLDFFKDGSDIYLRSVKTSWGGLAFQHGFVTDQTHLIEFGSPDVDIYTAQVTINRSIRNKYPSDPKDSTYCKKMDKHVRDRMRHVLGMCNYSLCLRNCEHIANYIFHGRWISSQMKDQGRLKPYFSKRMSKDQICMVNSLPAMLHPHIVGDENSEKLYSFIDENYSCTSFDYYLDDEENTYNVLVVGPTGAGKSHLINVFFNQKVCDADVSHRSVTKDINFVRGRGLVYNIENNSYEERNIVVADTIGLCDTDWDDKQVINLIHGRVSSNIKDIDAVFVVFRVDRLLKEHVENIKMILKWLKYSVGKNFLRFWFIGTYAEFLSDEKKALLRQEAIDMLDLQHTKRFNLATGEELQFLVYTGFPPEDTLNDKTKQKVEESWKNLKPFLMVPGSNTRIPIEKSCSIL